MVCILGFYGFLEISQQNIHLLLDDIDFEGSHRRPHAYNSLIPDAEENCSMTRKYFNSVQFDVNLW